MFLYSRLVYVVVHRWHTHSYDTSWDHGNYKSIIIAMILTVYHITLGNNRQV